MKTEMEIRMEVLSQHLDDIRDVAIRITDRLVDEEIISFRESVTDFVRDLIVSEICIGFAKGVKPNIEFVTKQTNNQ